MTFMAALATARDLLALGALLGTALVATALFGGVGAATGAAGSIAVLCASALAALAIYGLGAGVFGAPAWAVFAAAAAAVAAGGAWGAHSFGVRGLWVAALAAGGVGAAAAFLWGALSAEARLLGPWAPMAFFAGLSAAVFGALGAVAESATRRGDPGGAAWRLATHSFATPPDWFDCAYAAVGGDAARPGFCGFNAPKIASAPIWSRGERRAGLKDAPLAVDRGSDPEGAPSAAEVATRDPARARSPSGLNLSTPDFAALEGTLPDQAPRTPSALTGAAARSVLADGATLSVAEPETADLSAPELRAEPEALSASTLADADATPDRDAAIEGVAIEVPAFAIEEDPARVDAAPAREDDPAEAAAAVETRRMRVCFSHLDAAIDRACLGPRVSERDLTATFTGADGASTAAIDRVSCSLAPRRSAHVTLVVSLSGGLLEGMPRGPGAAARIIRADAMHQAVSQLVGAARGAMASAARGGASSEDASAALSLSMYVANGSRLLSPWAMREGVMREGVMREGAMREGAMREGAAQESSAAAGADASAEARLFDVGSSSQTLALFRRLKAELQALKREAGEADLAQALLKVLAERPETPEEAARGGAPIIVALMTAGAMARTPESAWETLAEAFDASDAQFFPIEIGGARPDLALTALARRTGGVAAAAPDFSALDDRLGRVLRHASALCDLEIAAPASFFERGALEVRLRRTGEGGCAFQQVAVFTCDGARLERSGPAAEEPGVAAAE